MDPLLVIAPAVLSVDPGGEARAKVTVRNPSELVEQYRLTVLGDAARWSELVPRELSFVPDGINNEQTVEVVFRPPPAPAAPAGQVPFGVRCVSRERPDRCAVVEGDIVVSAVHDLKVDLEPVGAAGRWKGRFRLDLINTGTLPITVRVDAVDEADLLRFAIAPREITVEARETAAVYLAVRPRTAKTVGKPVEHIMTVTYEVPETDKSGELRTNYEQRALIAKWMIISAVVVVLVLAAFLAIAVFRPGADPGPPLTPGPPPTIGGAPTVAVLGPDSVQVDWAANPYADSYELRATRQERTLLTTTVKAPIVSFEWTEIPGAGQTCFQVIPVDQYGSGAPTPANCEVMLQGVVAAESSVAAASSAAASESTASAVAASAAASSAAAASAVASSAAAANAAASSAAAASASAAAASSKATASSAPSSGAAVGTLSPKRFWVVYFRTPVTGGVVADADKVTAALQQAGVPRVQTIESSTLAKPFSSAPFFMVIADDFPDEATARAECAARNNVVPGVTSCTVQQPG